MATAITDAQLSRSKLKLGERERVKGKRGLLTAFSLFLSKDAVKSQPYCEGLNVSVDPPTDSEGVELCMGTSDWGGLDEGGTLVWLFGACSDRLRISFL